LKELNESGIITIKTKTLNHANIGDYASPSPEYPYGRLKAGGHGQAGMNECNTKGIDYAVTGTYTNGVRIGSVPSSDAKLKRDGGQTWFPDSWTDDDIRCAGTYTANSGALLMDGYHKTAAYKGVAVRILQDSAGNITTICPDYDQYIYVEGVELL
jgi:hypothetical protein